MIRGMVVLMPLLFAACGRHDAEAMASRAQVVREVVFVANAEDGTVSVLDARSFRIVREYDVIPDGPRPAVQDDPEHALLGQRLVEAAGGLNYAQDLDIAPDGRVLYVSRGHRGDVAAFDLQTGELLWRVPVAGVRADHMTISGDGRRLYVSALSENKVEVVDTERAAVVGAFATGQWPHDSHWSPDGRRLYNASIGNMLLPEELRAAQPAALDPAVPAPYQLTVVDPERLQILKTYRLERGLRPYEITHDGKRLFGQLSQYSGVVEFDLEQGRISRSLDLPIKPGTTEDDYDFEAPHHGLALSPDESTLCLAGRISDYVALVETAALKPRAIIPVGDAPSWAANSPDGRHCFVANNRDDTVSVISYAAAAEVARVAVGDGPKFLLGARVPAAVICGDSGCP